MSSQGIFRESGHAILYNYNTMGTYHAVLLRLVVSSLLVGAVTNVVPTSVVILKNRNE